MNKCMIGLAAACLVGVVEAKVTQFSGTGDWQTPERWNNGVPGAADEAQVLSGASASIDGTTVSVATNAVIGTLAMKDGALAVSQDFRLGGPGNDSPKVTATNSDLSFRDFRQLNAGSGSYSFAQDGGTFKVSNLVDFYGNNVSTTLFNSVSATFAGYRWALYRAAMPSLWKFTDSVVTNAASSDFMMGVWGDSTGDLVFDHSTFDLSGSGFNVGYGNETAERPATLRFENGSTVIKRREVNVGTVKHRTEQDPFHGGWGRIVGVNSTWTNTTLTRLHLGYNEYSNPVERAPKGELILSNCTYWAETENVANVGQSALCVGHAANSTGIVQIVGGKFSSRSVFCGCQAGSYGEVEIGGNPEMNVSELWIGYAAGATGKLILHDRSQSNFVPSIPGCTVKYSFSGAHRIIEYVNSAVSHTTGGNWNVNAISGADSGAEIVRIVDGGFTNTAGIAMLGGTWDLAAPLENFSGLELVRSKVLSTSGVIIGRHAGMPGYLMLKDCGEVSMGWPTMGYVAGAIGKYVNEGTKVSFGEIRVCGNVDGTTCLYRDGAGAETTITDNMKDFRIGDKSGTFDVELGGKLTCGRFFVGMNGTVTGEVRIVEGADVTASSSFNLGWKDKDDRASLCLNGGVLKVPGIAAYNGDYACPCKIYCDGGTLQAQKDEGNFIHNIYARTAVGKGGAVFDSNGFSVTTAVPLTHDDREGAPAADGGIVKKGAGTVKLTGALSFTGGLRVEAGTLDLSAATYAATPSLAGSGTLIPPTGGLTVTGANKVTAGETLAVSGNVTFGAGATVAFADPEDVRLDTPYTLLTATSVTGVPKMDMPKKRGVVYDVVNTGTAIVCTAHKPGLFITVQ